MSTAWSWSRSDWDRIERVAREERRLRAVLADPRPVDRGPLFIKATRAQLASNAMELRQWAAVATSTR